MTKQEFLDNLRMALSGRASAYTVEENVRYYEDYIRTQVRMGRSEEEVLKELGDPRLLARSIAEAGRHAETGQARDAQYVSGDNFGEDNGYGYDRGYRGKVYRMPGWLIAFLVVFVIIIILSAVFSVLSFLAPILLPVLIIMMVIKVLRRH